MNLILVPGLLCDPDLWAHQTEHLADLADVQVADITGGGSVDDLAQQVLAEAPDTFALAGLSMGGYVVEAIMRAAPERVERLALLDTSGRADTDEQKEMRKNLLEASQSGGLEALTSVLLPAFVHPDRLGDTALVERIDAMTRRVGVEVFREQLPAIMNRPDSRPDFANYDLPTLVLCGRQDALTPLERHEEMAELIPGAKLAIIEECGHLTTMERPQATTALLRHWLIYG